MSTGQISVIIPCYWATDELIRMSHECFKSCRNTTPPGTDIIVVNDGSPLVDNLADVEMPENQGYGSAVNVGLDAAKGDYLVICNNDIIFIQPNWLHHLLKPLTEGAGISTIRTTEPDGWQTEDRYEENAKFGSLWAMTRATYKTLGSLDERFGKGYGEDLDYWHRARNAGIRIVKNHNGLAEHKGKATFKITDPKDMAFNKFIITYKEKWPDESHAFIFNGNQIICFNKWELADMSVEDRQHYCERELSLTEIKEIYRSQGWI